MSVSCGFFSWKGRDNFSIAVNAILNLSESCIKTFKKKGNIEEIDRMICPNILFQSGQFHVV
ncbi:MAG: hypothetical protein DRJ14_09840 [Acidobacteria bacterium]|nr:MAG: hypothetical protein DRJ14_09840 [Acidobacteriota bacterium]